VGVNSISPDDFKPLPLAVRSDEQVLAARAEAEALLAEANRMHRQAATDAERICDEAQQHLDSIQARTSKKQRRDEQIDDWSPRVALGAVIGLTATGEYSLAQLAGWYAGIAWLLPLGIDVYVVQALRRHRDVFPALILMVAANAVYHLAAAGLFGVRADSHGALKPEWWLIASVAAIAPWVMLRIHRITAPPKPLREHPMEAPADSDSGAHSERAHAPAEQQQEASAASVPERPPGTPTERSEERPEERSVERAQHPKSERAHRAHSKPKKRARLSAPKTLTERRTERVRELYTELAKRPEWTDIRAALVAAKLADKTISRSSCQRVRDAIEAEHPELAALGSDNVRAITGT
jgi:hypothetical protein